MEIVLVGLNHRTAPVEVREKVSFNAEQARRAADELRSRGILEETLVLSTCNRSEVYGVPPESSHECAPAVFLFERVPRSAAGSAQRIALSSLRPGSSAHLFRVSAGLDSMLLGEAEILGQVREAYRFCARTGSYRPGAEPDVSSALEVGKRVRTETDLGRDRCPWHPRE